MSSKSKSIMPWERADRHFPVRVRIPGGRPGGFGQTLNHMHHWLHERVGLKRFYQWNEHLTDNLFFYFDDLDVAKEFVAHFECAMMVQGPPPP